MEPVMLKIIAGVAIVIAVAIAVVLVLAASKPDTFRIERSATIDAPPEKIFAVLSDLRQWGGWSPWEKKDPDMKRTFGGPERGKGAVYGWEGNKEVGKGRMEITDSQAPGKLTAHDEPDPPANVVDQAHAGQRRERMAAAKAEHRPASQIVREFMRDYVKQDREYVAFLQRKVDAARADIAAGRGHSDEEVRWDMDALIAELERKALEAAE